MPGSSATVAYAFAAGLLSFLSPCVLPLVPGYVSLLSGAAGQAGAEADARAVRRALTWNSLCFILGFTLVFIALGATATRVGQTLQRYQALLSQLGGLIVILFGLHLLGVIRIGFLYGDQRIHRRFAASGGLGAFLVGFTFAFGWTPCIGPMLTAILLLAARAATVGRGVFLLAVYSLGLAAPFWLTTLALDRFTNFYRGFRRHLPMVERVSGVLLLLIGVLLLSHRFTLLSGYLARIPFFNKILI